MRDFRVGSSVQCPADRGDRPYAGKIVDIGSRTYHNHRGIPYRWILVEKAGRHGATRHIWPSNRLGA